MQRLKLTFLALVLSFEFGTHTASSAPGTGGNPSTGGTPGVGGGTGLGGSPTIRRHVGTIVEGTSYLTYLSYLCLTLIAFGIIGVQFDKNIPRNKQ